MSTEQQARYPLNAAGDFYVANGLCIMCMAPEHEAPDLMAHDPQAHCGYHCYFKRQPETPEELDRAIMAVAVGCCGAVRYGGSDPAILQRFADLGAADACDHLSPRLESPRPLAWWRDSPWLVVVLVALAVSATLLIAFFARGK